MICKSKNTPHAGLGARLDQTGAAMPASQHQVGQPLLARRIGKSVCVPTSKKKEPCGRIMRVEQSRSFHPPPSPSPPRHQCKAYMAKKTWHSHGTITTTRNSRPVPRLFFISILIELKVFFCVLPQVACGLRIMHFNNNIMWSRARARGHTFIIALRPAGRGMLNLCHGRQKFGALL